MEPSRFPSIAAANGLSASPHLPIGFIVICSARQIRQRLLFKGRLTPRMGLAILRLNEHPLHLRVCRLDAALDARHGLFDF
jgi:hypothetical protein